MFELTDAPFQWNRHLENPLRKLKYKPGILDACLYTLHIEDQLQGMITLTTDDMVAGGTKEHLAASC